MLIDGHNYNKETVLGIDYSPVVDWNRIRSCFGNRFESLGDAGWGDPGEIAFWKRFPEGPRKNAVYAPKTASQVMQIIENKSCGLVGIGQ